jgi:hypothetical protein
MRASSYLAVLLCALLVSACGEGGGTDGGKADTKPLTITSTGLPAAQVGVAFPETITATGGDKPYLWSVQSGTLPLGLALTPGTPAATFAGTPTTHGSYNFTVEVRDASFASASAAFTVAVQPAASVSITTTAVTDAMRGSFYSADVVTSGGTQVGYTWAVSTGTLPPGLTLFGNNVNALIQGIPTVPGTFNFDLEVTDSGGATASQSFSMTVHDQLSIVTTNLPGGIMSMPYSQSIQAVGGVGPTYVWSVIGGQLPTGISFAGAGLTCSFVGTPTQYGFFVFTVQIEDSNSNVASLQYGINVLASGPLLMNSMGTPLGNQHTPYGAVFEAAGGTPPYLWSIVQGTLPPGLAVQSIGTIAAIEGTPQTVGTWGLVLELRDAQGAFVTNSLNITVSGAAMGIAKTSVLQALVVGHYCVELFQAVNATSGMLLWSVVGGTLPLGLSFEATPGGGCMVFGTPTTAGTYVFALELFNAATTVGVTRVFALEVRDSSGPLTIATQYLGECRLSDGIHVRLEAAGGSGSGHIWSVAPGAVLGRCRKERGVLPDAISGSLRCSRGGGVGRSGRCPCRPVVRSSDRLDLQSVPHDVDAEPGLHLHG